MFSSDAPMAEMYIANIPTVQNPKIIYLLS